MGKREYNRMHDKCECDTEMKNSKALERRRNPLSDVTNSNPSKPNPLPSSSSSSSTFNTTRGTVGLHVSEPISAFCNRIHTLNEKKRKIKKTMTNPKFSTIRLTLTIPPFFSHTKFNTTMIKGAKFNYYFSSIFHKIPPMNYSVGVYVSFVPNRDKSDGVELEGLDLPKASLLTVRCRKKRRAVSNEQDVSKDAQLQDYIEKQNAYFKEIDEFELPEEEVESVNELD